MNKMIERLNGFSSADGIARQNVIIGGVGSSKSSFLYLTVDKVLTRAGVSLDQIKTIKIGLREPLDNQLLWADLKLFHVETTVILDPYSSGLQALVDAHRALLAEEEYPFALAIEVGPQVISLAILKKTNYLNKQRWPFDGIVCSIIGPKQPDPTRAILAKANTALAKRQEPRISRADIAYILHDSEAPSSFAMFCHSFQDGTFKAGDLVLLSCTKLDRSSAILIRI